jgi:hypothetical protein
MLSGRLGRSAARALREIAMDPVSNVDHIVLLLRQRLLERTKAPATGGHARAAATKPSTASLDTLQALAAVETLDDRQLRRALVQNILVEALGSQLLNDAKFQRVVDRVTETLEADPAMGRLLGRLVGELRLSAR